MGRIVQQTSSDTYSWRTSKRPLVEPGCMHWAKPEGVKVVEAPPAVVFSMREKRHIRQNPSKEEHYDRPVGPKTVVRDNGYRAADQIAQEIDVNSEMQRKVRTQGLLSARN